MRLNSHDSFFLIECPDLQAFYMLLNLDDSFLSY